MDIVIFQNHQFKSESNFLFVYFALSLYNEFTILFDPSYGASNVEICHVSLYDDVMYLSKVQYI